MTVFGDKVFKEVIQLKFYYQSEFQANMTGVLIKRANLDTETHGEGGRCDCTGRMISTKQATPEATKTSNTRGHQTVKERLGIDSRPQTREGNNTVDMLSFGLPASRTM